LIPERYTMKLLRCMGSLFNPAAAQFAANDVPLSLILARIAVFVETIQEKSYSWPM
jgi:hypothetical protein